jgi:hypothetical protein
LSSSSSSSSSNSPCAFAFLAAPLGINRYSTAESQKGGWTAQNNFCQGGFQNKFGLVATGLNATLTLELVYYSSGTSLGASLFEILWTRVGWIPSAIYLGGILQSNMDLFERVCVGGLSFTTDKYFLYSSTQDTTTAGRGGDLQDPLSFNSSGDLHAALGTTEVAPIGSLV